MLLHCPMMHWREGSQWESRRCVCYVADTLEGCVAEVDVHFLLHLRDFVDVTDVDEVHVHVAGVLSQLLLV